jgi:APA family basic amino acid/polyamine antiporter
MSVRRGGRPPASPPTLRRMLGLREAVALGIGGTVGGGIFVLVGAAAGTAVPAAVLAYLLAFAASLAIVLPYAELACRLPLAGGGYAFVRAVLGPELGSSWAGATGGRTCRRTCCCPGT